MKTNINLRQEIITLIRGYFITPVIGSLAKITILKIKKFYNLKVKVKNYIKLSPKSWLCKKN